MKILVVGSNGQLGWELCRQAEERGVEIVGMDIPDIDICDPNSVRTHVLDRDISIVVNAAAYTAVDKAESEKEIAFEVNEKGPENLSASCAEAGIPLIHISTDYVFNGTKSIPYNESDPISPLGVYGESKAAGEAAVQKNIERHIIIRTAWLSGFHGNNFVKTMIRLGMEKDILKVVADQKGCPTFAEDLAGAVLRITGLCAKSGDIIPWGTYHYCGAGSTTWYGFAEKIFEFVKVHLPLKVKDVLPVNTEEYKTAAKRPANSVLDCSKINQAFGIMPVSWEDGLKVLVDRLSRYKFIDLVPKGRLELPRECSH